MPSVSPPAPLKRLMAFWLSYVGEGGGGAGGSSADRRLTISATAVCNSTIVACRDCSVGFGILFRAENSAVPSGTGAVAKRGPGGDCRGSIFISGVGGGGGSKISWGF